MSLNKLNIPGLIRLAVLIVLVLVGLVLVRKVSNALDSRHNTEVNSTVVLEKIERVLKLVTVEGNYSELMEYKDFQYLDIWGLRKKAIVKVTGKVLVGYDLEKMQLEVNDKEKVIRFVKLPEPEILAIDTDLSYYDIEEGIFNSFGEKDLTALNAKAKNLIRNKAVEQRLQEEARKSLKENLDIITLTAKAQGWEVRYPEQIDTPKH